MGVQCTWLTVGTLTLGEKSSVTRCGEISPLWQNIKKFLCLYLFIIWQNAQPTLGNLLCFWAHFHCCKWPNIQQII